MNQGSPLSLFRSVITPDSFALMAETWYVFIVCTSVWFHRYTGLMYNVISGLNSLRTCMCLFGSPRWNYYSVTYFKYWFDALQCLTSRALLSDASTSYESHELQPLISSTWMHMMEQDASDQELKAERPGNKALGYMCREFTRQHSF